MSLPPPLSQRALALSYARIQVSLDLDKCELFSDDACGRFVRALFKRLIAPFRGGLYIGKHAKLGIEDVISPGKRVNIG